MQENGRSKKRLILRGVDEDGDEDLTPENPSVTRVDIENPQSALDDLSALEKAVESIEQKIWSTDALINVKAHEEYRINLGVTLPNHIENKWVFESSTALTESGHVMQNELATILDPGFTRNAATQAACVSLQYILRVREQVSGLFVRTIPQSSHADLVRLATLCDAYLSVVLTMAALGRTQDEPDVPFPIQLEWNRRNNMIAVNERLSILCVYVFTLLDPICSSLSIGNSAVSVWSSVNSFIQPSNVDKNWVKSFIAYRDEYIRDCLYEDE